MVLLDTDFIIDLMRGHGGAVEKLEESLESPDPLGISVISLMQLFHGVARSPLPELETEKIERALKGIASLDLTREIASDAGQLDGALAQRGEAIDPSDVIIGATAVSRNEAVVTRNRRHFERIKGLRILGY